MQPQGPSVPGGPYANGGQQPYNPYAPGQVPPGGIPQPVHPGQQPVAGQQLRPAIPSQPPVPAYEMPAHLRQSATVPDNLPPPPPAPTTPYDFFMNQSGKSHVDGTPASPGGRRAISLSNLDGGSKGRFALIIGGGGLVIALLFAVVAFSPKDSGGQQLFKIAQIQQEIVRVCGDGASKSKLRATRNFAVTCSTSVASNQTELLAYMNAKHIEYKPKLLAAYASAATSAKLKSASASSSYDSTFRTIMEGELTAYDRSLTSQLALTTGASAREILNKSQTANSLLLKMVKDNSDQTQAVSGEN